MRDAYEQIVEEGFVVIGVSTEANLSQKSLVEYADRNDFKWRFALASVPWVEAVVAFYGSQAIVPPSTPHFILSADGELGPLRLGIKSGNEILSELRAAE